ncbi:MAG: HAMP domain-containing sensor histidine kinase [Archangium sp.]|nr:HAMP domain-containing sensor histidine kinase [Archangium sp.]MDP3155998.1 HAMP domain-containing sensor histidine kinase [Archangium sp.]MDP3574488.1 HAMP domain-containing sensor histidine kinase [Archangium sp.]
MTTEPEPEQPSTPERLQTDESLRAERERADGALAESMSAVDDIADAVIIRARQRADGVLAAARAKSDRTSPVATTPALVKERGKEDRVLQEERATADEILKEERAEHVTLLNNEREETDKDLVRERGRSDDALATRDEFLSIVSHDLRTLLSQVMGYAGLISMEVAAQQFGAQVISNADRIQRSGTRMNRLIGDLVDVASIHAGTLIVTRQEEDPVRAVTEAVDTFQAQAVARGISVSSETDLAPINVLFDPARILQVLTNLLSNALKFTPAKGTIVVRVERVANELQFSVSDTGIGIPADKLEAIFERYLQINSNDRRGVGLGLYISKCIIQGHGGRIWAESKLGKGSTFSFTLPIEAQA